MAALMCIAIFMYVSDSLHTGDDSVRSAVDLPANKQAGSSRQNDSSGLVRHETNPVMQEKSDDSGEGEPHRKAEISEAELVARAYHPGSAGELEETVWQLGPTHPDAFATMDSADTLCSVYADPSRIEEFRRMSVPGIESSEQSLDYLFRYSNRFCDGFSADTFNQETKSYSAWLEEAAQTADNSNARRLFEITLNEIHGTRRSLEDKEKIREELKEILASTDSPYLFKEAASRLLHGRYGEWQVGPELDNRMDGSEPDEVKQIGLMLAYCRVSNACGPNSMQSIETCAPYHCRPGITVREVYQDMYSPYAMRIAERIAQDILKHRRQNGPG